MPTTLNNPLTIIGGTGVTASNSGDPWYGDIPLNQLISIGNDISKTGNVQFNQITGSTALISGRLTVNEVFTQYVSSSVLVESSGSTKLGNESTDLHQITGSVSIQSGSLTLHGTAAAVDKISGSAYSTGSFGRIEASTVEAIFGTTSQATLSGSFMDKAGAAVSGTFATAAATSQSFMAKDGAAVSASFVTNEQSGSFASG